MGETVCDHDDVDDSRIMENLHDHVQSAHNNTDSEVVEKMHDSEVKEIDDSAVMDDMLKDHGDSESIVKVENHDDYKILENELDDDDMVNVHKNPKLTNDMIKQ